MARKSLMKDIREGKHVKEGMYTDILRVPHMTITYFIVKLLKRTFITPNMITLFVLFLMLVSAFFFAQGNYVAGLWAALFYYASFVFDTVDGCLARERGISSPLGGWYDHMADRIMNPILFFAITWGVYKHNPTAIIWIWTFIAFAALEFSVIMQYNFRRMFDFGLDVIKAERKKRGFLKEFMLNDFFLCHSIIFFALFGILNYYMVFFSFYAWAFNIAMTVVMTYKAKRLSKLKIRDRKNAKKREY